MRRTLVMAVAAALFAASPIVVASETTPWEAAVLDASRPAEDKERDAARHPAELLKFSGVKDGDTVVDFLPGGGYFTRLFSSVAGASGKVFAWVPAGAPAEYIAAAKKAVEGRANAVANVEDPVLGPYTFSNVDVIWTSQNYHDMHTSSFGGLDVAKFNKLMFDALKPGGVYVIVDHVAVAGSGHAVCETLHRIDPALVKQEVEAAGFVFEEESKVLANPDDKHDANVFDEAIRGKTDQFVYKFRKPAPG